jgi:hypothetical protein
MRSTLTRRPGSRRSARGSSLIGTVATSTGGGEFECADPELWRRRGPPTLNLCDLGRHVGLPTSPPGSNADLRVLASPR